MNSPKTSGRVPGSFRDPSGFLFQRDGLLYRQVNLAYRAEYDQLVDSGLYQALTDAGLLIPHQEAQVEAADVGIAYKILQPEPIPFITYPYEWSFSQLKDAALTTLEIQKRALEYEMSLKDSSAYNIQIREGRPVLIDTLSFETFREGQPWVAYRQFCQHFLAPLALMSAKDVRLNQLFRVYIDGVPLDLASALLPARTRLDFGQLSHLHLHARSQRRYAGEPVQVTDRTMSRMAFRGLVDSLERTVKKLDWQPEGTEWVDYLQDTNYSQAALEHKTSLVAEYLSRTGAKLVWDLGANTGLFSRLASDKGRLTISADVDPACVEVNYLHSRETGETHILPILLDLTNPGPSLGWANEERMSLVERGPADTVLALALVHHLAISNNVPLERIAGLMARICQWLIIEFVPKNDSQVQKLLMTREDIFGGYTQEAFEAAFGAAFAIRASARIQESERTLYLMEREYN